MAKPSSTIPPVLCSELPPLYIAPKGQVCPLARNGRRADYNAARQVALCAALLFSQGCVFARYTSGDSTVTLAKFGLETKIGELQAASAKGDSLKLSGAADQIIITPSALAGLIANRPTHAPAQTPDLSPRAGGVAGTPATVSP